MNIHAQSDLGEFKLPPLEPSDVRNAVNIANGEEGLVLRQRRAFETHNPGVHEEQSCIVFCDSKLPALNFRRKAIIRKLKFTAKRHYALSATKRHRVPFPQHLISYGYLGLSCGALYMSNRVGTNYIVKSGVELYAGDPDGAAMFFGVAILAGATLKISEQRLPNDLAKNIFFGCLASIGLVGFVIWTLMLGQIFAPEVGAQPLWLLGSAPNARSQTILLMVSHIIVDITLSYTTFWGAISALLGGYELLSHPNPVYADLEADLIAVDNQIARVLSRSGEAEEFLRQYAAALDAVEEATRHAFRCEVAHLAQLRAAANANADSKFLNR